jgi:hypothetical protein
MTFLLSFCIFLRLSGTTAKAGAFPEKQRGFPKKF